MLISKDVFDIIERIKDSDLIKKASQFLEKPRRDEVIRELFKKGEFGDLIEVLKSVPEKERGEWAIKIINKSLRRDLSNDVPQAVEAANLLPTTERITQCRKILKWIGNHDYMITDIAKLIPENKRGEMFNEFLQKNLRNGDDKFILRILKTLPRPERIEWTEKLLREQTKMKEMAPFQIEKAKETAKLLLFLMKKETLRQLDRKNNA